ncbi:mechanosensitive ion channel family protein [Pseudochryseolinea flava]|uniref:Mechanosensitive ion channel family protein n=2 Tax=Pseudochryseolinea flava TaxID=2059302 RepID=A0A364XZ75_9BACT|nr:mechanosensitive ion channel family protein [Pseudochryseolinea flava]
MGFRWLEAHGPSILVALIIFFLGQWIIRILKRWIHNSMERREVSQSIRPFLQSFIATILQILLLIVVLQILSVKMTIFTAIVTSFGVAAGLALSGTLQNFTGGILILLLKPFRVGDNIIAQGQDGIVDSIEIFYTIITTQDNRTVIIPNSKLSNEVIVNISRQGIRRMEVEMKFSFGIDLQQVTAVVKNCVKHCAELRDDPAPYVGVSVLDPDGYKIMIHAWVEALNHNQLKLQFQKNLVDDLKKAGLKLPGT